MTIIKMEANENGFHAMQSQSHRKTCWMEGYIEVPPELENEAWETMGWCDLTIEDGKLTGITPTEKPVLPEPEEPVDERQAVEQEITDLMLADIEQGQFSTALQLKLMEVMQRV